MNAISAMIFAECHFNNDFYWMPHQQRFLLNAILTRISTECHINNDFLLYAISTVISAECHSNNGVFSMHSRDWVADNSAFYWVLVKLMSSVTVWLYLLLIIIIALLPDILLRILHDIKNHRTVYRPVSNSFVWWAWKGAQVGSREDGLRVGEWVGGGGGRWGEGCMLSLLCAVCVLLKERAGGGERERV